MSLYQNQYPFRGVVFTTSNTVIDFCKILNITHIIEYETNEYGLPIVRSMLQRMREIIDADYYGYMNSDILLNSKVFDALHVVSTAVKNGEITDRIELISQVKNVFPILIPTDNTLNGFDSYFQSMDPTAKMRNALSAVKPCFYSDL